MSCRNRQFPFHTRGREKEDSTLHTFWFPRRCEVFRPILDHCCLNRYIAHKRFSMMTVKQLLELVQGATSRKGSCSAICCLPVPSAGVGVLQPRHESLLLSRLPHLGFRNQLEKEQPLTLSSVWSTGWWCLTLAASRSFCHKPDK